MHKLVPFYGLKLAQVEKFLYLCSRKGIPEQAYKLTQKGLELLATMEEDSAEGKDWLYGISGVVYGELAENQKKSYIFNDFRSNTCVCQIFYVILQAKLCKWEIEAWSSVIDGKAG